MGDHSSLSRNFTLELRGSGALPLAPVLLSILDSPVALLLVLLRSLSDSPHLQRPYSSRVRKIVKNWRKEIVEKCVYSVQDPRTNSEVTTHNTLITPVIRESSM
jgi:hypothetical protein